MAEISATLTTWAPRVRSILRIMTGLLFLQHGTMKYFNFPPSDYVRRRTGQHDAAWPAASS